MFNPATKEGTRVRAAIFGPSGSGKTYTSLRIATGIGGRIAVIDTERRTARKYSDKFKFDVCDMDDCSIPNYIKMIELANSYDVLIIDSLTHAWQDLLQDIDRMAKAKFGGNTWAAWSEGTPKQRMLIDALCNSPCHIIATIRSKTEWQTTRDSNGKMRPSRVGLAPEQGKGIEYEFDMLIELTTDHLATIIKDRSGKYQDSMIPMLGEKFGKNLADWLKVSPAETPPKLSTNLSTSPPIPPIPTMPTI